jgi:RND family efflux transporter MFP subunit
MKRFVLVALLLVLVAGAFQAGSWYSSREAVQPTAAGSRKVLYYVDPMNPTHTSDKPGIAPCGMPMEPVYADEDSASQGPLPLGTVNVSPARQQTIGVRVSPVAKIPGTYTLRVLGRVVPNENTVYRLNAGIDGFIREVSAAAIGDFVKKDQVLATFSAPSSINVIQTYILNLGAAERAKQAAAQRSVEAQSAPLAAANIQQRVDQLQNMGMSLLQIEEIQRTREVPQIIKILAPANGIILASNVYPALKFDRGAEFYQIADLSRIWVLADVPESEARYVRPGTNAKVLLPRQRRYFTAKVTSALPQADKASPVLKVRLEVDKPGFSLKPDMMVDVEFPVSLPAALAVPEDAVLDSGLKKTVFVDVGNGSFEPRQVETGWRLGDKVEIVKGLTEGERVVISGNFLIDSESRIRTAAAGMQAAMHGQHAHGHHAPAHEHLGQRAQDPVCLMEVDAGKAKAAGLSSEYGGKTYYFCMAECKQKFDRNPGGFLGKTAEGEKTKASQHVHGLDTSAPQQAHGNDEPAPPHAHGRDASAQEHAHHHDAPGPEHTHGHDAPAPDHAHGHNTPAHEHPMKN